MNLRKANSGFTLIELVVVITIVGILAAVALPRYVAMQQDARIAKAQALYGSIRSAAALAHSRCLLDLARGLAGVCTAAAGTADMEGTAVAMLNQYPTFNTTGAGTCALGTRSFTGIIQAAQITDCSDGVTISSGASPTTVRIAGATTAANCQISYATAGVGGSPNILIDVTGC
jgi:MSHA pilin protein MshA